MIQIKARVHCYGDDVKDHYAPYYRDMTVVLEGMPIQSGHAKVWIESWLYENKVRFSEIEILEMIVIPFFVAVGNQIVYHAFGAAGGIDLVKIPHHFSRRAR